MAKQIIVTQHNYGMELKIQFLDKETKRPIDLSNHTVNIEFIDPNEQFLEASQGSVTDAANGLASFILQQKHTALEGLYKSYWSIAEDTENINSQEDLFYYVKAKNGGVDTPISGGDIDFDSVVDKFKDIDAEQITQNERLVIVESKNVLQDEEIKKTNVTLTQVKTKGDETRQILDELVLNNESAQVITEVTLARQGKESLVSNIQEMKDTAAALNTKVDLNKTNIDSSINSLTTQVGSINSGLSSKVNNADFTDTKVLEKVKRVDGIGSGLDADMLDGKDSTYYAIKSEVVHKDDCEITTYDEYPNLQIVKKYSDGRLEIFMRRDINVAIATSWGSCFITGNNGIDVGTYKVPFIEEIPLAMPSIISNTGGNAILMIVQSRGDKNKAPKIDLMRPTKLESSTVMSIQCHTIGRWK